MSGCTLTACLTDRGVLVYLSRTCRLGGCGGLTAGGWALRQGPGWAA